MSGGDAEVKRVLVGVGGGGDDGDGDVDTGPVQVRTRFEPKVRSSQHPDPDLPKQVRSTLSWP